jgi:hypothetical protein
MANLLDTVRFTAFTFRHFFAEIAAAKSFFKLKL